MVGPSEAHPELNELADPGRVAEFLADAAGMERRSLTITGQAKSGSSNVTLFISWGDEEMVLRRPPRGPLLPTSHDMLREYRFLTALQDTSVPVPRTVAVCEDVGVIGVPFYVMERVDGALLQDGCPPALQNAAARRQLCESAIDALVAIHGVDWDSRGLADRRDPYLQRQLRLWARQLELTSTKDRLPGLDKVGGWLEKHMPPLQAPTIVHGDFGLHNMIVTADVPARVRAVLDWEMATIGDPLADLVWFLRGWGIWPGANPANEITSLPGALTADEMFELYHEKSGRSLTNRKFYDVFSAWKGAIILEGLYASYLEGNAANKNVARFEHEVPESVRKLLAQLE